MFAAETKLSGRSGAFRSGPVRENDAKNSQLLEDAVGARKELCEQCALPAPRQSGENSGLENNLEAPDPTESHPLAGLRALQKSHKCLDVDNFPQLSHDLRSVTVTSERRPAVVDFSQAVTLSKRKVRKRKHLTRRAFPLELQLRTSLF